MLRFRGGAIIGLAQPLYADSFDSGWDMRKISASSSLQVDVFA
jgi:hypothetical protein